MPVQLMVVLCLLAGLVARSAFGHKLHGRIDGFLLRVFPGYAWIKGVTTDISQKDNEGPLKPVLVRFDDQAQLGFEMDRTADGLVAIYLPGAPDPRGGTLSYVTTDRGQAIEAGAQAVIVTCKRLGRDSAALVGGSKA